MGDDAIVPENIASFFFKLKNKLRGGTHHLMSRIFQFAECVVNRVVRKLGTGYA